jgi:DNA-binding NarL/FixJ family response regulator/GGDEF domain-containing protein
VPSWPAHNRRATDRVQNGHNGGSALLEERRTWSAGSGQSVVACVDVQPSIRANGQPQRNDLLWRLALRRMERCIRPGDQVCMLGGPRVAVVLGNGADRVAPSALGRRLANAMGDHLAVGATGLDLRVTIGIGTGTSDVEPSALAAAAMTSIRLTRDRATAGPGASSAFVAVTHVPEHQALVASGPALVEPDTADACRRRSVRHPRRLDRRVLVPLSDDGRLGAAPAIAPDGWSVLGPGDARDALGGTALRVLLVDPETTPDHSPRPVMEAVAAVARRFGARPALSPAVDVDAVLLDLYLTKPDVVVVVLQPEVYRLGARMPSTYGWDRPARLTRALREAGTPVIALSVGASAAALAVCVEQGAIGLLHTDLLSHELARQTMRRPTANGGQSTNGFEESRGPGQLPAPYDALVHLTPSERRVLFHMMEGRSAADIATTLVVSLTTVRSHIRSILRKLNVNSQLAAVALAFGSLPDQAAAD